MIRFHLAKLMADKGFTERRRIEIGEISVATGIHRSTLSRVLNKPGVNLTADNMSRLCGFFGCTLSDLAEYVDDVPPASASEIAARPTKQPPASKRVTAKKVRAAKARPGAA
ncbi:helix-turn-helix transcriptional regulator [Ramlibacter sp. G-1-2-2]|uniref:Helix-turn-helix transcriptional regulator n=1 Tax=Ramlibacter agri TaxID=2728837 RepID=A0A848HEW8_9BURK|nr:helix-turn-helix transcriptional regulator [Ramlibacter agri]NML48020.1 helix-turn-helix transcriptional regulator [Ramlibacter agri]